MTHRPYVKTYVKGKLPAMTVADKNKQAAIQAQAALEQARARAASVVESKPKQ